MPREKLFIKADGPLWQAASPYKFGRYSKGGGNRNQKAQGGTAFPAVYGQGRGNFLPIRRSASRAYKGAVLFPDDGTPQRLCGFQGYGYIF